MFGFIHAHNIRWRQTSSLIIVTIYKNWPLLSNETRNTLLRFWGPAEPWAAAFWTWTWLLPSIFLHVVHYATVFSNVSLCPYTDHVIWTQNMPHLHIEIPTSINREVWERIMLHTGITDCSLFSQGAFPYHFANETPQCEVPEARVGYLKSLQTNTWQMRWNSTNMNIWTWDGG